MIAWNSPSSSNWLSDLPDWLATIELLRAVGSTVGLPCFFGLLIAPSTHSVLAKSMPCSSLSRPRMNTAAVMVNSGTPMRLPLSSFGDLMCLRLMKMKLWRNTREANTGIATNGFWPPTKRETNSELENSEAPYSCRAAMLSKMTRGLSSTRNLKSTPSTGTSPV